MSEDRLERIQASHADHRYLGGDEWCYICWLIAEVDRLRAENVRLTDRCGTARRIMKCYSGEDTAMDIWMEGKP